MSAVFGLLHRDGKPVDPEHLVGMDAAMAMHGRDRHGIRIHGYTGLGYRLTRFTIEDQFEDQPLSPREGLVWLVSDARIDNRQELAEDLDIRASEAAGMADSAFILRAWQRWGSECAQHLIGAYSFALFDARTDTLLLAASPRGERVLFYALTDRVFAFASAPKGLFALPWFSRQIDRARLADFLLRKTPEQGSTFYSGIRSLLPGHTMHIRRDSVETRRFWSASGHPPIRFSRDDDYVEAFAAIFDRAVKDSLRSAGPIGIMVSGGLDSSSIAAVAAQNLASAGGMLHAFTEVPENGASVATPVGRYADETPLVEALVKQYRNIEPNYIRTPGVFFLDGIEPLFDAAEVPARNPVNHSWMRSIYEHAQKQGIRALLTGMGGNLTMSWNGQDLLPQLIRAGRWLQTLRAARRGYASNTVRTLLSGLSSVLPEPVWLAWQRARHPGDTFFARDSPWQAYSPISREFFLEQRRPERTPSKGYNWQFRSNSRARFETLERCDYGADFQRGYEAMFNTQTRSPADDQRVLEFCLSLPEDQFVRAGTDRWLLRRTFAGRLPSEILLNNSRGLQAADWVDKLTAARPRILDELNLLERCELARYTIDLPTVRTLIERLPHVVDPRSPESLRVRVKIGVGLMTGRYLRWFDSCT